MVAELIDAAQLLAFVGTTAPTPADQDWAAACSAAINAAATLYVEGDPPRDPPGAAADPAHVGHAEVVTAAQLAAAELYRRRDAPFGTTGFADASGNVIRLARDALEGVKPLLWRWRDPSAGIA